LEVTKVVAVAAGPWGSAAQYTYRKASKLEEHGIQDGNLLRLQRLVAEEIVAGRGLTPSSA
jgi:glutathione-specific gamma-glutamylcyclotransferase